MLGRGKRASKFLRQVTRGSVDKAIKEYEEILKQDDSNPDLWNTLGDLYLRAKNREKALECYEKSLDLYIKDGYTDNAIAVGKKILRYDPNRHMVHLQLARLYADPDIKNYKGALDEIRRFYETAQEVSIADLNQIMSLLSQIWEPLSSENAAENMPIFDNLFKLTEELIEQISMTGFDTQSTIPLTQMDLGKLEEEFGGPIEQEETPEPMTEVESAEAVEAEPLQGEAPTLPEVEEVSAGEDLIAPPEPASSEGEPTAPEAPTLAELEELEEDLENAEEIQILDEAPPTLTLEEEDSVEPPSPAPSATPQEEEPEELRILEQAAAEESLNLEEEVEEVVEVVQEEPPEVLTETPPREVAEAAQPRPAEPTPAAAPPSSPSTSAPSLTADPSALVALLRDLRTTLPDQPFPYPVDYEEAGLALERMGLLKAALSAFALALETTAHPEAVYARMGHLFLKQGAFRLALRAFHHALSRSEHLPVHDQARVYAALSRVYRNLGEEARADEAWEEACLRNPELCNQHGSQV